MNSLSAGSLRRAEVLMLACVLAICHAVTVAGQTAPSSNAAVPNMMKFSGALSDATGKPLTGTVGVSFFLYKDESGGAPLWMETQNVQADKSGHYSVMLGAGSRNGLPTDVFAAGEARWLAVQASGQAEQPRTLLLSVPYALKALDAETLGGRPASAFLAAPAAGSTAGNNSSASPLTEQPNEIICSSTTA